MATPPPDSPSMSFPAPPPVTPTTKPDGRRRGPLLVAGALIALVGLVVVLFLVARNGDQPPDASDSIADEGNAVEEDSSGPVLGALTATFDEPGQPWRDEGDSWGQAFGAVDSDQAYWLDFSEVWGSIIISGTVNQDRIEYDAGDLESVVEQALEQFTERNIWSIESLEISTTSYTPMQVDGHDVLLAELEISWPPQEHIADSFERHAILVGDIDGERAVIAEAAITESHLDHYETAIEVLTSISFGDCGTPAEESSRWLLDASMRHRVGGNHLDVREKLWRARYRVLQGKYISRWA